MSKAKVIQFPGVRSTAAGAVQPEGALAPPSRFDNDPPALTPDQASALERMPPGAPASAYLHTADGEMLNADQQKAIALVLSGMTFICIGIEPAKTGADFFTALHGDHDELRNAEQHLPEVIGRLYSRKGVR